MTAQEPAMGVSDEVRTQFEAWVSAPPFEYSAARWPVSGASAWPGNYRDLHVQLAWEAWQAALPHMQPAGEAVVTKKHDPSLGPCQWPDCGHDTNQSDSTPGCLGAFCDATRKQATPPQPSAEPQQEADSERVSQEHVGNLVQFIATAPRTERDTPEPPSADGRDGVVIDDAMVERGVEEIRKAKHQGFDRWTDHKAIRAILTAAIAAQREAGEG